MNVTEIVWLIMMIISLWIGIRAMARYPDVSGISTHLKEYMWMIIVGTPAILFTTVVSESLEKCSFDLIFQLHGPIGISIGIFLFAVFIEWRRMVHDID